MSNLVLTPEIQEAFQPAVISVMRNTLAPTATDAEFVLFAHKAASYGLDPFKNEIFFIKYGSTARIQFAAEAYLAKAREKEGFQPPDTQMVHENDEFRAVKDAETGKTVIEKHEIGFPRGKIIGAYSIAYRDNYRPVAVLMDIEEVSHMFTGQNKDNWKKWTADMFGKHVQQRALKKQYGLEFDDEVIDGSAEQEQPRVRKDITPNEPEQTQQEVVSDPTKAARAEVQKRFVTLGISDKAEVQKYIQTHAPNASNPMSLSDLKGLISIMDQHIELNASVANDELEQE